MKKCSFCGHENQDNAKFCANCGRTFVVKEIRQKLGKTFEILGYVAIGLGLFAFIFELVDNIIWGAGFFAYPLWLVKYLLLAALGLVYLYAQKVKSQTLSLLLTTALMTHVLIFFIGMNFSAVFSDFASTFFILFIFLLAYLFATLVLLYLNNDWGNKLARFYPLLVVGLVGIYAFLNMLYLFIFGFRTTFFRTIAFQALSLFFYYGALAVLFALPIVDKEIDTMEQQGDKETLRKSAQPTSKPSEKKAVELVEDRQVESKEESPLEQEAPHSEEEKA